MSRLARIKMARGVTAELREAIERQARGEPMHLIDTIARLSHIAVYSNSDLEVQLADERDRSLQALHGVRERMRETISPSPAAAGGRCSSPPWTMPSTRPTSRSQPGRAAARRRPRHAGASGST